MRIKHAGGVVLAVFACAVAAIVPAAASASPASTAAAHAISINAAPNPVVTGDPVVVFGRLVGPNHANRPVHLWHRIAGQFFFTPIQTTMTDAGGFYEFSRAEGVVTTNRAWYVRSAGVRSRTVLERVQALVALSGPPDGSTLYTGPKNKVTFTGTVTPAKPGALVVLQRQSSAVGGDDWHTIDRGRVGPGGEYTIVHTFRVPGDANIRALLRRDGKNIASPSNTLSYQISQAQNPALTINPSADPITVGQTTTISGVLQGGANKLVTLLAKTDHTSLQPVAVTTTDGSGNYSFAPQSPINNTIYVVRGGGKSSARLYEGVKDLLTENTSATTVSAGQSVTFSGTVTPNKTGHLINLERKNLSNGDFHVVQVSVVAPGSVYSITHKLYEPGTKVFRVHITGGPENQGAATPPITITVTPSPASALTP